jgi:hypothetical protein
VLVVDRVDEPPDDLERRRCGLREVVAGHDTSLVGRTVSSRDRSQTRKAATTPL